jgi:hypothetical protein
MKLLLPDVKVAQTKKANSKRRAGANGRTSVNDEVVPAISHLPHSPEPNASQKISPTINIETITKFVAIRYPQHTHVRLVLQPINNMAIANPLLNIVVRGFQVLFGIVVLGISVALIRGHHWGSLPATLGFSAFVGGVTILGAAFGVAALFFSVLDGMLGLIIDTVVALINVAGGIVSASLGRNDISDLAIGYCN